MKYKVGDKVKIINNDDNAFKIGEIATIEEIDEQRNYSVCCKNEHNYEWLKEEEIAPFDYTWEDFLKAPIGTKVTFEDGKHIFKVDKCELEEEFADITDIYSYGELDDFRESEFGKIIKIEEPVYQTVYEPKEEVTMPEIEEMKRLTDELCKTCDEFIKKIKESKDE